VTPVHLAVFLFALSVIFAGGAAVGYGVGLALAIRGHNSRNYRLRVEGDNHLRAEEKGVACFVTG
jgi:hypothetical protein